MRYTGAIEHHPKHIKPVQRRLYRLYTSALNGHLNGRCRMADLKIIYNKATSDSTTDPVIITAAVFTCKVNFLLLPTIVILEIITTKLWVERSKNSFRF